MDEFEQGILDNLEKYAIRKETDNHCEVYWEIKVDLIRRSIHDARFQLCPAHQHLKQDTYLSYCYMCKNEQFDRGIKRMKERIEELQRYHPREEIFDTPTKAGEKAAWIEEAEEGEYVLFEDIEKVEL